MADPSDSKSPSRTGPLKVQPANRPKSKAEVAASITYEQLKKILAPTALTSQESPEAADSLSQQEERQYELEKKKAAASMATSSAADLANLVDQRKGFANKFVSIAAGWLVFVAGVIVANALDSVAFSVSDSVIKWLLTTTTVNVLAPAYLVAKYLFGKPK